MMKPRVGIETRVGLVWPAADRCAFLSRADCLPAIVAKSQLQQAKTLFGPGVILIAWHAASQELFDPYSGRAVPWLSRELEDNAPKSTLLINGAFVQERSHHPYDLIREVNADDLSVLVLPGEILHAVGYRSVRSRRKIVELLHALTDSSPRHVGEFKAYRIAPNRSGLQAAPSMTGIESAARKPRYDSAPFLNAALRELSVASRCDGVPDDDPVRLAGALQARRETSAVPWIFNELLCDLEHRLARPRPDSVPPEIHMAVTGTCNIECRFCSYDHTQQIPGSVSAEQIGGLDFLKSMRTMRLHSGNGESTTNPHFGAIIRTIAENHPHIEMNFSTNGILLDRRGLIDAIVDCDVSWINVSLNAATRASWNEFHGADRFDRVCANVRALHAAKQAARKLTPLILGSMVLTRHSVHELPLMPELCRSLGIDYFTAIPFSSFGYGRGDRYGPDDNYRAVGSDYAKIFAATKKAARLHNVSVELPRPTSHANFGLEKRVLFDFARVENEGGWRLHRLLSSFTGVPAQRFTSCPTLWRTAHIGRTTTVNRAQHEPHYLYPCLGPLGAADLSSQLPFRFSDRDGFDRLWLNPLMENLRTAQQCPGKSPICDACRGSDSRAPQTHPEFQRLLQDFAYSP